MNFETLYAIFKEGKRGSIIYSDNLQNEIIITKNARVESLGTTNSPNINEVKIEFNLQFYIEKEKLEEIMERKKVIFYPIQYNFIVENNKINFELLNTTERVDSLDVSTMQLMDSARRPEIRILGFYYDFQCSKIMNEEIKEQKITNRFSIMEIE